MGFKLSRSVLRWCLKVEWEVQCLTDKRREFQMLGALYEKDLLPKSVATLGLSRRC